MRQQAMLTVAEQKLLNKLTARVLNGKMPHGVFTHFVAKADGIDRTIDFAIPDVKLGIEIDGNLFHSTTEQRRLDRDRDLALAKEGWKIVRFLDETVMDETDAVAKDIIRMSKEMAK